MSKSCTNTILVRISEVAKLLIKGNGREDIVQYCAKHFKISERQADKYIQRAKEEIEISAKRNIEYEYGKAVKRYELLFNLAVDGKNYKVALQINKELVNLQGLVKAQSDYVSREDDPYYYQTLSDEELAAEIAKHKQYSK